MPVGFRILPIAKRAPAALIAKLGEQVTPHLSDSMQRLYGMSHAIVPMHDKTTKLFGSAFTVKTAPGDNLLVHKAIDLAEPGDVIVVDAGGVCENAIIGDIMTSHAKKRGVAGFVIDGAIRDAGELALRNYPVFARGANHRGPYKNGPGEINVPVAIGGVAVMPGDIIVGDQDGVVVVPLAEAEAVLESALAIARKEAGTLAGIAAGKTDRAWVDAALREKGVKV